MKRSFDVFMALTGLLLGSPILILGAVASLVSTRAWPIFTQERVGLDGRTFRIYKLRTMRPTAEGGTVTVAGDRRVTTVGALLRKTKLDELPQLVNVLRGDMSLVGPRPDVLGYADRLEGEDDRAVLTVRPGITSPAATLLRDEEALLAEFDDPEWVNDHILYPAKTSMNREYARSRTFVGDLLVIARTLLPMSIQPGLREQSMKMQERLIAMARQARDSGES